MNTSSKRYLYKNVGGIVSVYVKGGYRRPQGHPCTLNDKSNLQSLSSTRKKIQIEKFYYCSASGMNKDEIKFPS